MSLEIIQDFNSLKNRRCGKTHAIAKACKEADGIMICSNSSEAKRIKHEYGIKTMALHDVESGKTNWLKNPNFYDHWAYEELIREQYYHIKRLTKEIREISSTQNFD